MYSIMENDSEVGTVCMKKAGLYYRFDCVCSPKKPGKYHVCIRGEEKILDLGLCVPEHDRFVLHASIPIKHIPAGQLQFSLIERQAKEQLVPVADHQPFDRLVMLKTARLVRQSGQLFIHPYTAPDR